MENILYNISQVLGITIIHSLWQGLVIYFVLRVVLLLPGKLTSAHKYLLALGSLFFITAWFAYTLINEIQLYNWLAVRPEKLSAMPLMLELPSRLRQVDAQNIRYYYSIAAYLPYVTIVYILGLFFNTTRLLLARKKINAIRSSMSIAVQLQQQVNKFERLLGISTKVKIGLSNLVDVPCITGYFKPVILLPFTLSTYLSAEEIESIILHELAHIKRNDYLVNLVQQVISILLFFNPCAQLINRIINEERENCCDDMVVNVTANPLLYAKALLKLEQNRQTGWQLALAATGKKYHLLTRIERIMKTKTQVPSIRPALLAMLIITIGIGSIALLNPEIAQGKVSVKSIKPVIETLIADTNKKVVSATSKTVTTKAVVTKKHPVKKNVNVYNYHGNTYYGPDFNDPQLDKLSAEVSKYGDAISKYYESGDFKKVQEELEKKGREMEDYYNQPALKKMQLDQEKLGREFQDKWGDNSETKKLGEQMEEAGKKIERYYNSPEFKQLNADLEKKYNIPHNHNYYDDRDENYRKYNDELKRHIPAEITEQSAELKKMGEQMRNHFNSPEYKAQSEQMRAMGDSMRKAFNNPRIKELQQDMKKLGEEMRSFQGNAEIKLDQQKLKEASERLREYTNSPEFKKRAEQWQKSYRVENWDEKSDKPEKAEKSEKPDTSNQN